MADISKIKLGNTTYNIKDASAIHSHQDISGKADKVSNATNGNFAGLDANGNLTDSGVKASDFVSKTSTSAQSMAGNLSAPAITATGTISAASFNATSSRKMKENIEDAEIDALSLVDEIRIVKYNYINDDEKTPHIGFIAEDTDSIFSTPHHNVMDYTNCIGVLLKAVQQLKAEIEELRKGR